MTPETQLQKEWARADAVLRAEGTVSEEGSPGRALFRVFQAFEAARRAPRRTVSALLASVVVAGAAIIGRQGTSSARGCAVSLVLLGLGGVGAFFFAARRRTLPQLFRVFGRHAPEATSRLQRALSLLARPEHASDGTSTELARVHFDRTASALPLRAISADFAARTDREHLVVLVVGTAVAFAAISARWALFEGADVLFARDRVAPLPIAWFESAGVKVHPPPYLHLDDWTVELPGVVVVPSGSTLMFRGVPEREAAHVSLLVPDGVVPFVSDGRGRVVAEWQCDGSADVAVGARFGDVFIADPLQLRVRVVPDVAPRVSLDGAPREIRGEAEVPRGGGIVLVYEAVDDHGLSAIDLVLRSGTREERRSLVHLDGERTYSGAEVVRLRDPFIKASVSKVELSIEARDNDATKGPKWGKSAAITYTPREIGHGEAARLDSLRDLRGAVIDSLAFRLSHAVPKSGDAVAEFLDTERQMHEGDESKMNATFGIRYEGLTVPFSMQRVLRGFADREASAIKIEADQPGLATHVDVVRANERWAIAIDRLVQASGASDAKKVAKRLADVADGLAQIEDDLAVGRNESTAEAHAVESETLLASVAGSMLHLGSLGNDLGEIVVAYLSRVTRAEETGDYASARLAAADLALRLHTPDPSFGSKGGPSRKGGESGGSSGSDSESDPAEDGADGQGGGGGGEGSGDSGEDGLSAELQRLAAEHSGQMAELEEKARAVKQKQAEDGPRDLLRKHAAAVREALRDLPSQGEGSDSWTSKGAAARESGEQMAHALESDGLDEAVGAGRHALGVLDEAAQVANAGRRFGIGRELRVIEEAKEAMKKELAWVENAARVEEERAAEALRSTMQSQASAEQRLARKVEQLANGSASGGRSQRHGNAAPESVADALGEARRAADEASRQLAAKDLEHGRENQKGVQRALERAVQQLDDEKADEQSGTRNSPNGDHGAAASNVTVPGIEAHKGPDELRRRVLDGLGKGAAGRMKDAVRRYADGLLR